MLRVIYADCHLWWVSQITPLCWVSLCWMSLFWASLCWVSWHPIMILSTVCMHLCMWVCEWVSRHNDNRKIDSRQNDNLPFISDRNWINSSFKSTRHCLSISPTAINITTFSITKNVKLSIILVLYLLSIILGRIYNECHKFTLYAECRYADCC